MEQPINLENILSEWVKIRADENNLKKLRIGLENQIISFFPPLFMDRVKVYQHGKYRITIETSTTYEFKLNELIKYLKQTPLEIDRWPINYKSRMNKTMLMWIKDRHPDIYEGIMKLVFVHVPKTNVYVQCDDDYILTKED